jgi:hypothetical protein
VLVCSKRKVLLAGCWWLVCSERKVLLADKPSEEGDIGLFYKLAWPVIKRDLVQALNQIKYSV